MVNRDFLISEEQGGGRYPDLGTAQGAALSGLAAELAEVIRELLAEGSLVEEGDHLVVRGLRADAVRPYGRGWRR
jgi:hypothetical protein